MELERYLYELLSFISVVIIQKADIFIYLLYNIIYLMNNSYDDTENKILGNLLRIPLNSKSLNQLSKDVSLSYVTVFKVVPELEKKKLVVIEKKGKSNLVSIDFVNASLQKLSSSIIFEQIKLY